MPIRRLSLLACLLAAPAIAGPPSLLWSQLHAPTVGGDNQFGGGVFDSSGNLNIACFGDSMGNGLSLHVIRYDSAGNILGALAMADDDDSPDYQTALFLDGSGNYVVAGRGSASDRSQVGVAKYNPVTGAVIWATLYLESSQHYDHTGAGMDAAGNTYVLTNQGQNPPVHPIVVKVSPSGDIVWARTLSGFLGGSSTAYGSDLAGNPAGGCFVGGYDMKWGVGMLWNVDASGNVFWSMSLAGNPNAVAHGAGSIYVAYQYGSQVGLQRFTTAGVPLTGVTLTPSFTNLQVSGVAVSPGGAPYVCGTAQVVAGRYAGLLVAYDVSVTGTLWGDTYDYGESESGSLAANGVVLDASGTPHLVTTVGGSTGCGSCRVAGDLLTRGLIPATGSVAWTRRYDYAPVPSARDVAVDASGGVYMLTDKPSTLVKYSSGGAIAWTRSYANPLYCIERFGRVVVRGSEEYVSAKVNLTVTYCGNGETRRALNVVAYQSTGAPAFADFTWIPPWGEVEPGPLACSPGGDIFVGCSTRTGTGGSATMYQSVVAFSAVGTVMWTRTVAVVGPQQSEEMTGIGIDAGLNVYALGVGSDVAQNTVMRVTKMDYGGNWLWTVTVTGGLPFSYPTGMAVDSAAGRIYLSGAESDNIQSPTVLRGAIVGLDTNGNKVWTRSNHGGQLMLYWDVAVNASGTVFATGVICSTVNLSSQKEGIDAVGTGDIIVDAYDPTDPCPAPAWSTRWDSGLGDEEGVAIAAGSVAVVGRTPQGPRILKYGEGSADPAALVAGITTSPAGPVDVGTQVAFSFTVTDTGGRAAVGIAATLMLSSGASAFEPLQGPWGSGPPDLISGASRTWTWTTTAIGAGTVQLTATGSGTDACSGSPVNGTSVRTIQTGYRSAMGAYLTVTRTICGIGDWVKVDLSVTNGGAAGAVLNSVTATVYLSNWSVAEWIAGADQGLFTLNAGGGPQPFSWTFSVSGSMVPPETFYVTASGLDPVFGAMTATATGSAQLVNQARLSATLPVGGVTSVGGVITVQAFVRNLGGSAAMAVTATILVATGGGTMAVSPPVPAVATIQAGAATLFTWTMTATGAGPGTFTVTVTGTDASVLGYPLTAVGIGGGTIQTPPNIVGRNFHPVTTVEVGQSFLRLFSLTNTGQATAQGLQDLRTTFGTATATVAGPGTPQFSVTLTGFQTVVYSLTLTGVTPGTYWQSRTVTGYDVNTGFTVTSGAIVSNMVTILQRPILTASTTAFRPGAGAQAHLGQKFLAMLTVTNTGGVTANGVSPGWFGYSTEGEASPVGGPNPAGPASLAPGASITFTWTMVGSAAGTLYLTNSVTGVSAMSGLTAYSGPAMSNAIVLQPLLSASVIATPSVINGGQTSLIRLTVSNTGASTAAVIMPYLNLSPDASATTGNASSSNLTLSPGQSATVSWDLTGLGRALVAVTAYVTAVDAFDATYGVAAAASTLVDVTSSMASRAVIIPATVTVGETFRIDLTVTNGGTVLIQDVIPSVTLAPSGLATVGAPDPASEANLFVGASRTFSWSGVADSAGILTLSVGASGTPVAGTVDSTRQTLTLVIKKKAGSVPEFSGEAIVYPNPVAGDTVSIAVRLKGDATKIEVDAYNTGYQRVWHGEFPAATAGDWALDIAGVSKWAPGVYLVRIRATKADGGTQVFKTIRVGVKR
ncbi:MAG: hypothetical protein AAB152_12605 [Candidatus Coatesbacteria bacterium]